MRVVIAEDSLLLREGIASLLAADGFEVVGQAGSASELLEGIARWQPDVAVVDIRMPPMFRDEGIRAATEIGKTHPRVGVLVLSQYVEPEFAMRLLEQRTEGRGYLLKDHLPDLNVLTSSIRIVGDGGSFVDAAVVERLVRGSASSEVAALSPREREILSLMAEGRSNVAICSKLSLSPKTIEGNIARIFMKLDLPPAADDHRRVLAVLRYLSAVAP